ncbi:hypothetical protein Ddye_022705 [Dipteronia dyeriana]|uniref:Uncharacterized protein n=1 Tax=Dipteronia dyeriana TaxID=168575 RepID=A0AAD9TRL0_9ROSI|nr:hypothetical protein Ddye_022705 [Dipteronia dyeriana]
MVEVSIISTEIIKPSSPTPDHLRTYKLSLLDQISSQKYYSFVHFYSGPCETSTLKAALSNTLTHYYPFAGRVHDDFSIVCDDTGATFIEAKVSGDVSDILKRPQNEVMEHLVPQQQSTTNHEILAVQLNRFNCGGVAISVGFRHVVADAVAAANFIKTWATLASATGADITENVVYDCTSIFPPQDISGVPINHMRSSQGITLKRFVFDCSNISALRQEFGNQTTRFQVLAALVWGAVISAKRATNHEYEPNAMSIATLPINLRKKADSDSVSAPIPDQCIGNIISPAIAFCPIKDTVDYKILAAKLQESISRISMESVKKTSADGSRLLRGRGTSKNNNQRSMLMISSLCRLPFYDTDFGWGKPVWVTIVRPEYDDSAVFFDTRDGKGIELWIQLPEQDMAVFEQDPTILAYASFNPSVSV